MSSISDILNSLYMLTSATEKTLLEILQELKKSNIDENGFTFSKVYLKRLSNITATSKAIDSKADFEIYSLDTNVIIKSLAIVPDSAFKTHGILLIEINGVPFLEATTALDFNDVNSLTIPLPQEGIKLKRSKKIRFFVWTNDGTPSALTIEALVAKDVKNIE